MYKAKKTWVIPIVISIISLLPTIIIIFAKFPEGLHDDNWFHHKVNYHPFWIITYRKMWCRSSPYMFGLIVAYLQSKGKSYCQNNVLL